MVATTDRFTNPAEKYADRLLQNDDPHPIELIDGEDLREITDEIGLHLYNGRIEILCDETLRPYDPAADVNAPVQEAFRDIEAADLPVPHSQVTFRPVVAITADTNAVFETSVGVIHRINDRTQFVVHAERGNSKVADDDVATLVTENFHVTVPLDTRQFTEGFDDVEVFLVAVDAVGRILDAVAQQEQRLVQMLHIGRLEEIRWLSRVDRSLWVAIQIELNRGDLVQEHKRRSRVARSPFGVSRIEQLFQLCEIPEDAPRVSVRMPVHLRDAVGAAICLTGLFDSLDESELAPCRHRYSPARVCRYPSPAQKQHTQS